MSFRLSYITVKLSNNSAISGLKGFERELSRWPGLKVGEDYVVNPAEGKANYDFAVTGHSPIAVEAIATIAKTWTLKVSRLGVAMVLTAGIESYDDASLYRYYYQACKVTGEHYEKRLPRKTRTQTAFVNGERWTFGGRSGLNQLIIERNETLHTCSVNWLLRDDLAQSAFLMLDTTCDFTNQNVGLVWCGVTNYLLGKDYFGLGFNQDAMLEGNPEKKVVVKKNFEDWLFGLVAHRVAKHCFETPKPVDEIIEALRVDVHSIVSSMYDKAYFDSMPDLKKGSTKVPYTLPKDL